MMDNLIAGMDRMTFGIGRLLMLPSLQRFVQGARIKGQFNTPDVRSVIYGSPGGRVAGAAGATVGRKLSTGNVPLSEEELRTSNMNAGQPYGDREVDATVNPYKRNHLLD